MDSLACGIDVIAGDLLPTILVVQVYSSRSGVGVCLCVRTISLESKVLWPIYLLRWFTLTLSLGKF